MIDWAHRPTSIKTRIETERIDNVGIVPDLLTDQLPLKQGLKPKSIINRYDGHVLTDQLPLKQGLKLLNLFIYRNIYATHRPTSIKTRIETILL